MSSVIGRFKSIVKQIENEINKALKPTISKLLLVIPLV
jgi:hypothetical protein